jgi:hypothetical protein
MHNQTFILMFDTPNNHKMAVVINPDNLNSTLKSIKARFDTDDIEKMDDISGIYSTGLKAALGMGHDGYVTKFNKPEKFIIEDLIKLSQITNVDIEKILKVVIKQAIKNVPKRDISHLLKEA